MLSSLKESNQLNRQRDKKPCTFVIVIFAPLGYGRPGPKGEKGDTGYASSSGMI